MKIVVTGASGNVGTSLLGSLSLDEKVEEVIGVARRKPKINLAKVRWESLDISNDRIDPVVEGADALVHLAWVVQPSRVPEVMNRINIDGTKRLLDAMKRTAVKTLVIASSVGTYSPADDDQPRNESWPTGGISASRYSNEKVAVERMLDDFERDNPDVRVVRMRPSLIFKGEAATEIRRFFLGPLVPTALLRWRRVPVLPLPKNFRLQVTHTSDVADAFHRALTTDVRGAFNISGDPLLSRNDIADLLHAKPVDTPAPLIRKAIECSWKARLQNTDPGWFDLAMNIPVLDSTRARTELEWQPKVPAAHALMELIDGLARARGFASPPLRPNRSGI